MSARFGAVVAAGVVAATMVPSAAFALGNNRTVSRSCGSNYIASGWNANTEFAWAETQRASGTCAGSVGAAIQLANGVRTARVNNSGSQAYATRWDVRVRPQNGVHWGCLNCTATLT